jgi:bacterioferritin-associated ferredoxin
MYVCHCEVVSDREIQHAIASGARDVPAVASLCGAGGACAGCHPAIEQLLDDAVAAIREPRALRERQARRRIGRRTVSVVPARAAASC